MNSDRLTGALLGISRAKNCSNHFSLKLGEKISDQS
jgi:hypothetical protein